MIIKLLSGDLISLDTQSIEEAANLLRDHLFTSKIRLVDPDTGEEAVEPKDLLYAYSLAGDIVIKTPEPWWPSYSGHENLFERIDFYTFRPILSPKEFKEAVSGKLLPINGSFSTDSLAAFMMDTLHPLYSDYLLLLDIEHYLQLDLEYDIHVYLFERFPDPSLLERFAKQYNFSISSDFFDTAISYYLDPSYGIDISFFDTVLSIAPYLIHTDEVLHEVFRGLEVAQFDDLSFRKRVCLIKYLLENGVNPLHENRLGKTALEWFSDRYPTHAIQEALGDDYHRLER
jgi:hypothetical protein